MNSIRRLLSVLCLVLCFSPWLSKAQSTGTTGQLDPTQVYSTGNIVQPTVSGTGTTPWVNGVYQDQLTCWGWGDPGYCGPNPIVRPGGSINFSFGSTYLFQQQAVAAVLPNSGAGLQVSGFNFGFTAKNGNGWDDGRVDSLTALVRFWDTTGGRSLSNIVEKYEYGLTSRFNWTTFNFSETFTTPHAASKIGEVQYGFLGRDNNGWAGPYGPEIYGVNFSLRYSVDTCSIDPTSSPTCPGYLDAILKMIPPAPTAQTSTVTQIADVPTVIDPVTAQVSQSTTTGSTESAQLQSAPTPGPTPASVAAVSATVTAAATPSVTPTSSNERSSTAGPSIGAILNIVRSEQTRISGVESTVVQQANETAAAATSQALQQAESVAASATAASQTQAANQQGTVQGTGIQGTGGSLSGLNALTVPNTSVVTIGGLRAPDQSSGVMMSEMTSGVTSFLNPNNRFTDTTISLPSAPLSNASQTTSSTLQQSSSITENNSNNEIDNPTTVNFTMSPIKDYLDEKQNITPDTQSGNQRQLAVKRNVPENDAAGGITLVAMAKQPPGFELYQLGMRDNAFYPPKEIYKNQKIIDNQRVLRQMNNRSSALHDEMVNLQYK